jgi:hypothetical protein
MFQVALTLLKAMNKSEVFWAIITLLILVTIPAGLVHTHPHL